METTDEVSFETEQGGATLLFEEDGVLQLSIGMTDPSWDGGILRGEPSEMEDLARWILERAGEARAAIRGIPGVVE